MPFTMEPDAKLAAAARLLLDTFSFDVEPKQDSETLMRFIVAAQAAHEAEEQCIAGGEALTHLRYATFLRAFIEPIPVETTAEAQDREASPASPKPPRPYRTMTGL